MTHVDEHIIELLIIEPEALGAQRAVVQAHLAECAGCRSLAEKLATFYSEAEAEYLRDQTPPISVNRAVARRRQELSDEHESVKVSYRRRSPSPLVRIRDFSSRHPVAASSGAVAVLAVFGVLGMLVVNRGEREINPAFVHLNPGQEILEVYNAENTLLWKLPGENLASAQGSEEKFHVRFSQVADLDGDGKNEVVTALPLTLGSGKDPYALRIIDPRGHVVAEKTLGGAVSFAGTDYGSRYQPTAVLVNSLATSREKEILVGASNAHSPYVITRLSAKGEVLGEYWHYGVLYGLYLIEAAGKNLLIACGVDDSPDTTGEWGRSRGIILLLDPSRIVGKTECSFTRGFGFAPSTAELRYIVLPRSDIQESLRVTCGVQNMIQERDSTLNFSLRSSTLDFPPIFMFIFTKDLRPLAVKSTTTTEKEHARLVAEGRLTSTWGTAYFEDLRRRVMIVK